MLHSVRRILYMGLILVLLTSLLSLPAMAAGLTVGSIKADKIAARPGETITWTAAASGGSGTIRYCFYVYKGSAVVKKGSYSTAKTFSFAPTEAGTYKAKVFAKDASGTIVTRVSGNTTVSLPLKIGSVKANRTSAQTGTSITWTASASGGSGTLRYCFYVYKDGTVVKKGAYGAAGTFSYTPDTPGTYKAKVFVKDASGTTLSKLSGNTTVTGGALTLLGAEADRVDGEEGDTITWTASASGGTGPLRYCFYVYRDGSVIFKDVYCQSAVFSFVAGDPGTYQVKVFVKDAAGTVVSGMSEETEIYGPVTIEGIWLIGVNLDAPGDIGWEVGVSGGFGGYAYNFYVYKDGKSTPIKKSGWQADCLYLYPGAGKGVYTAKVFVKDLTTGAVVSELSDENEVW